MNHTRLREKSDRNNFGTDTIQTEGAVTPSSTNLVGESILIQDYYKHSYQVIPTGAGPWDAIFKIEVSNDGSNYTSIYEQQISSQDDAIAYHDEWYFSHARPLITGPSGSFLINERHLH